MNFAQLSKLTESGFNNSLEQLEAKCSEFEWTWVRPEPMTASLIATELDAGRHPSLKRDLGDELMVPSKVPVASNYEILPVLKFNYRSSKNPREIMKSRVDPLFLDDEDAVGTRTAKTRSRNVGLYS